MFQDTSLPLSEPVTMEMNTDSPYNSSYYFVPYFISGLWRMITTGRR